MNGSGAAAGPEVHSKARGMTGYRVHGGSFCCLGAVAGGKRGGDGPGRSSGMEIDNTQTIRVDWRNYGRLVMLFSSTSRAVMEDPFSHSAYCM